MLSGIKQRGSLTLKMLSKIELNNIFSFFFFLFYYFSVKINLAFHLNHLPDDYLKKKKIKVPDVPVHAFVIFFIFYFFLNIFFV